MKWYEEGEKNTQYFFSLEKRNKTKSHIRKLIGQTDDELTSPKSILRDNVHSHLCHAKRPMAVRGGGGLSNGRFP